MGTAFVELEQSESVKLSAPSTIGSRLDELGSGRRVWALVVLVALGGFVEIYELFSTAYIVPGIVREKILTVETSNFFGGGGVGMFVASMFAGLLVGTLGLGFLSDRFGRRPMMILSLVWYSAGNIGTAFQHDPVALDAWRFFSGVGLGIQMVAIDTYLSEIVARTVRGRAFALFHVIAYSATPVAAGVAWWLVPLSPGGFAGWRFVLLAGSAIGFAVSIAMIRLEESPRWLVTKGRFGQADLVLRRLGAGSTTGGGSGEPGVSEGHSLGANANPGHVGPLALFGAAYRRRTIMMAVFNIANAIAVYGFINWMPSFLIKQGISVASSLAYTFGMALAMPVGPLFALLFADRFERKWQLVVFSILFAIVGVIFGRAHAPFFVIAIGALLNITATLMAYNFHAYQAELFPTEIRSYAIGFVFSCSRLAGFFSGFLIAAALKDFGVPGAFALISGAMVIGAAFVAVAGPRTSRRSLETLAIGS